MFDITYCTNYPLATQKISPIWILLPIRYQKKVQQKQKQYHVTCFHMQL